jgi:hypothetical protein
VIRTDPGPRPAEPPRTITSKGHQYIRVDLLTIDTQKFVGALVDEHAQASTAAAAPRPLASALLSEAQPAERRRFGHDANRPREPAC